MSQSVLRLSLPSFGVPFAHLAQPVILAFAWIAKRRQHAETLGMLRDMTDRELSDLGVERSMLYRHPVIAVERGLMDRLMALR
jgi:uncharacterized protein YjiS (DUF1127 family)